MITSSPRERKTMTWVRRRTASADSPRSNLVNGLETRDVPACHGCEEPELARQSQVRASFRQKTQIFTSLLPTDFLRNPVDRMGSKLDFVTASVTVGIQQHFF